MFFIRSKKWILIILIVITSLAALTSLLLIKSGTETALAQEGTYGGSKKIGNYEAIQEAIKNQEPADWVVIPLDASSMAGDIDSQSDDSGIEVVPASAFRHDGNNANGWLHSLVDGYIRNNSGDLACFMAPTYPPAGATLTEFHFSLVDDSASSDLTVLLERIHLATGAVEIIAGGFLQNRDSPIAIEANDDTVTSGAVSNAHAYYVTLCFAPNTGAEILFYGARLFYTP